MPKGPAGRRAAHDTHPATSGLFFFASSKPFRAFVESDSSNRKS
jgi:hypothetical protein